MRNRKKALIPVFLAVFIYSGCKVAAYINERIQSRQTYSSLEEYAPFEEKDDEMELPEVDFEALREINPDIVGWLYCEGTVINYPVVQGDDNSYYLDHLFDGTKNASGKLFLDSRAEGGFDGRHLIIYGHNMKDGTMFASLNSYGSQEYYNTHPSLYLMTPDGCYIAELFAGYRADTEDDAWKISFDSDVEFEDWLKRALERSDFESGIVPGTEDRILTFSTCTSGNDRYVVSGILKKYDM